MPTILTQPRPSGAPPTQLVPKRRLSTRRYDDTLRISLFIVLNRDIKPQNRLLCLGYDTFVQIFWSCSDSWSFVILNPFERIRQKLSLQSRLRKVLPRPQIFVRSSF